MSAPFYIASIVECLGSKALVADEMAALTGRATTTASRRTPSRWRSTTSSRSAPRRWWCRPIGPRAAPTGSATPRARKRWSAGWKSACDACGVAWGGGETPALAGIVEAGRIDLAASCTGLINPKQRLSLGERLAPGDAIVLLAFERHPCQRPEPGAQAGRAAAAGLPDRGRARAELRRGAAGTDRAVLAGHRGAVARRHRAALLRQHHRPRLAQAVAPSRGVQLPHHTLPAGAAGAAISSSGMRRSTIGEAYSTFNMGAGFALFVAADEAARAVQIAQQLGFGALVAGAVHDGPKAADDRTAVAALRRRRPAIAMTSVAAIPSPTITRDGPPRMEARSTGSGGEPSSPSRCNQCRGQGSSLLCRGGDWPGGNPRSARGLRRQRNETQRSSPARRPWVSTVPAGRR